MEGGKEVKCYCLGGDSVSFFCLLAPLDCASDLLGLCLTKKLSIVICFCLRFKMFLKWHLALSLKMTACVFVTRDTVRHPRRFVFGKFVRKPNCSWSEAFVNGGLTVVVKIFVVILYKIILRWNSDVIYTYWVLNIIIKLLCVLAGRSAVDIWWWVRCSLCGQCTFVSTKIHQPEIF